MKFTIILVAFTLQGCATFVATHLGAGAAVISVAETADTLKTAGDVVSYETTNKTLTDHALSEVTGKDCNIINVINKYRKVCKERMPDLSTKEKIMAFQRAKGIETTGTIGPKTRMAVWRIKHELD